MKRVLKLHPPGSHVLSIVPEMNGNPVFKSLRDGSAGRGGKSASPVSGAESVVHWTGDGRVTVPGY